MVRALLLVVFSRIEATVNDVISGARCERRHGVRRCGRGWQGVGVRAGFGEAGREGTCCCAMIASSRAAGQ